jgi:hypothetical protein
MKKTSLFTIITAAFLLFSIVGCKKEGIDKGAGGPAAPAGGGNNPNLTIETVSGPDKQDCGGFDWKVKFNLNNASAKGGWIIQKISYERNVIKCPDQPYINDNKTYWEAWRVSAGARGDSERLAGKFNFDDEFKSPNFPDTRGSIIITGEVKFFEDLNLPPSFKKGNDSTYAGGLPSTTGKPDFWTDDNTASHNLSYIWNCCSADGIHVLTTTPNDPQNAPKVNADTTKLDYAGKLIMQIPVWAYNEYPTTSQQLVNIARQVQNTTSPAALHNSLVNYENVFSGASDYTDQMSKVYLLLRVMYQLPEEMNSSNAKTFGGWTHISIGNGSAYNMAWPIAATSSPSGWQVSISNFTGFIGRGYDAAAELDYFNANFERRNL